MHCFIAQSVYKARCLEYTKNDQTVETEGVIGYGTSVKMEQ